MGIEIDLLRPYTTYDLPEGTLVGVAFDGNSVWVYANGRTLLRAKWTQGGLAIEFDEHSLKRAQEESGD